MAKKHLVIGSGPAALSALEKIRSISEDDEIKLISMEGYPPYSPSVLPYLLAGRIDEADIWLRGEGYFRKLNVTFIKDKEVINVLSERKEVVYKDGDHDTYDTLLIATGSRPAKTIVQGMDEADILGFHIMDDYWSLLRELKGKKDLAIYGAGLVGIELGMALLEKGYSIKVIARSRILRRYFDEYVGTAIENIFRGQGAEIYTNSEINEVNKNKTGIKLLLSDGRSLETDMLITATGVEPRISFLGGSNINTNKGILVDSRMMTNIPDIYAAGDVAESPSFFTGQPGLNPILPSALSQGKTAGANMAGENTDEPGFIAMNILRFFGNSVFSIGLSAPHDDNYQVLEKKGEKGQFRRFVYEGDLLIGVMVLNVDIDPGAIHYLIQKRVGIGPNKEVLLEKPSEISRWLVLENEKMESKSI
ncbi:NAD(P)/FAD-dependent oxidoreductase [Chloroflexota bacterium]